MMTDYNTTRDAAGIVAARYENMLRRLSEDYQDEMVVVSLMNHYQLCSEPNTHEDGIEIDLDETILVAIERVLEDYMRSSDFNAWMLTRKGIAKLEDQEWVQEDWDWIIKEDGDA